MTRIWRAEGKVAPEVKERKGTALEKKLGDLGVHSAYREWE